VLPVLEDELTAKERKQLGLKGVVRKKPVKPAAPPKPKPKIPDEDVGVLTWQGATTMPEVKKEFYDKFEAIKLIMAQGYKSSANGVTALNSIGESLVEVMNTNPALRSIFKKAKTSAFKQARKCRIDICRGNVTKDLSSKLKKQWYTGGTDRTLGFFRPYVNQIVSMNGLEPKTRPFSKARIKLKERQWHSVGKHGEDRQVIFFHELGHYVHDTRLNKRFRTRWSDIHYKQQSTIFTDVGRYAKTNEDEFFAECFTAYIHPKYGKVGHRLPERVEKFFDDVFPKPKPPKSTKPMSSAKKLAACTISNVVLNVPAACKDYTRDGKQWYLKGAPIDDAATVKRLNGMRLPPAWRNVVVSTDPTAKVQAIGQDAAGRWQYRYSAEHIKAAARKKFDRVKSFTRDVPGIRRAYMDDLTDGDARAYLMRIMDKTAIRIGSAKDFKAKKKAYGLTTLQHEHVTVRGSTVTLDFIAKEGLPARYTFTDAKVAKWLRGRLESTGPGDKLFPDVPATKFNAYLKELAGGRKYTAKDFRTFHATRLAYEELQQYAGVTLGAKEKKRIIKEVSELVSNFLHNTPTMARNSYIDPMVWEFIGGLK
jgi:DNA topoisomerase-1